MSKVIVIGGGAAGAVAAIFAARNGHRVELFEKNEKIGKKLFITGKGRCNVTNAGILEEGLKPIDRFSDEDLDRIVETNEKGTMRCMRAAAQKMQAGASIVNVASIAGVKGCGGAAYVASKAAIVGVTKHTALRFQATGIRCRRY